MVAGRTLPEIQPIEARIRETDIVIMRVAREYAEQVTAEHKVNVKSGTRTVQEWVLKTSHADNHYLDCEVYAMCAADMLGARTFHLDAVEIEPRKEIKEPPTPEENWIGQNEGWLQGE